MSRRNGNGKSFAMGAFLGGLFGGITALLFAPKAGDKLRKDISKKYNEVSDKASDLLDEVCCQSEELVEKAKAIADDAKSAASKLLKRK